MLKIKLFATSLFIIFFMAFSFAQQFSTDGFYQLPNDQSRQVFSFNNGWLYHKGDIENAEKKQFNDDTWEQVQLPHGTDLFPESVSGGANYQGVVWYRKRFNLPKQIIEKHLTLTFEAIMGKCDIYLNGVKVKSYLGGYLPIVLDLSACKSLILEGENTIAVMADNSDDVNYPPGKTQLGLDFAYYGGIYRDAWLVATNEIYITHPNLVNEVAGGGVLVGFGKVSAALAEVKISTQIQNDQLTKQSLWYEVLVKMPNGKVVTKANRKFEINGQSKQTVTHEIRLDKPNLWSPEEPYLYQLHVLVKNKQGEIIDGFYQNLGVRKVELRGKEGMFLNGEPFNDKLIGVNHHQDYPVVGNAVPNNLVWHDVKVLRDAGVKILRLSHYPQDPALMDACDQLGVFVIVAIPGWQFWNKENPNFEKLMLENIRQTVRRDRNHACIFAWESNPNETHYPESFADAAYKATHAEYPFDDCVVACNYGASKWELYDLLYAHPFENVNLKTDKCVFTREWGDNVDNWMSHNSPSRVAFEWGEVPQLIQAKHYANPDYEYTSWEDLYCSPKQHIGGALWHAFDNGRGYHPDLFYGGILGPFRGPKYSYEMFKSQQSPESAYAKKNEKSPYHLFIANIMSPFSPADVTVYTNCDSVKLIAYGKETYTMSPPKDAKMPHPPLVFKNVFDFMKIKEISREQMYKVVSSQIEAIGYVNGKEVIKVTRKPAQRPTKLVLKIGIDGLVPQADGSTIIPVFAIIMDEKGEIKRLNETIVKFEIEGEGVLIGEGVEGINNMHKIVWGVAPTLVRTTLKPGKIIIKASALYKGGQTPKDAILEVNTVQSSYPSVYEAKSVAQMKKSYQKSTAINSAINVSDIERTKILKKVEKDQTDFMQHN